MLACVRGWRHDEDQQHTLLCACRHAPCSTCTLQPRHTHSHLCCAPCSAHSKELKTNKAGPAAEGASPDATLKGPSAAAAGASGRHPPLLEKPVDMALAVLDCYKPFLRVGCAGACAREEE